MPAGHIEVAPLDAPATVPVIGRVARTPVATNHSRAIGLGGTLILHALAAAMLIPATTVHKNRPLELAGATRRSDTAPADELVLMNVYQRKQLTDYAFPATLALRSQLARLEIPLVMPDQPRMIDLSSANADAETSTQTDVDPGNAEFRARMSGRYIAQINARIERAWADATETAHLGNTSDSDTFVCRVQVRQDERGNVQEVLLLACNGTEAWRHSLVVAINQSSPLPAPPIPTVFKRALTMTFEGRAGRKEILPESNEFASRGESMKP